MNVVDSSGWLEYFADGPNAATFAKPIQAVGSLIVPSLSLFEVFKRVMTQRGEDSALEAAALMRQGRVVPLDDALALDAARPSGRRTPISSTSKASATCRRPDARKIGDGIRLRIHDGRVVERFARTRTANRSPP